MSIKKEFDNAYSMLEDKLYKCGAYSYKDFKGSNNEAGEIIEDMLEIKNKIDGKMKFTISEIYNVLKVR